jgi:hypothetical protein
MPKKTGSVAAEMRRTAHEYLIANKLNQLRPKPMPSLINRLFQARSWHNDGRDTANWWSGYAVSTWRGHNARHSMVGPPFCEVNRLTIQEAINLPPGLLEASPDEL